MKWFLVIALLSCTALAEEFPGQSAEEEFSKGFGETQGMSESDKKEIDLDRMKFGGSLQGEYQVYSLEKSATLRDYVSTPMTLELYLDSQLKNDVRAFFKGRYVNDGSVDESVVSPLTGLTQKQSSSSLDEMKISFHSNRKVFWTVGRQKIKWGVSQFWNPTDFINSQRRDFLKQEDLRSGVTMIKAHVPWKESNFYFLAVNEKSYESRNVGAALRGEIPFSKGEWSFSSYSRQGQRTKLGSDLSMGLGDFDVYVEGAQSDQGLEKSASGGVTYSFKYNEEDAATLGFETFWQDSGTDDKSTYASMVLAGTFVPFFVGKNYAMTSIYLPKPGRWNESNLMFYGIQNLNDRSQYFRLSWGYTGMTSIAWTFSLGARAGDTDSEMKLFGQGWDGLVLMKVLF